MARLGAVAVFWMAAKKSLLMHATSSRTHLLQIEDHANVVLLEVRHNIILQHVLLPRPCHSQHLVAHPAAVKPRYSILALLATWVLMRAVPATLTKALNFLFDEKAPGPRQCVILNEKRTKCNVSGTII